MEEIIQTFHIDWKMLLAQVINFGIVVFVLYKFAYRPLLKHMNERTETIERGLEDAKKAQEKLEEADKDKEEKLKKAKKEALAILEEAGRQAEKNKETMVTEAREEAGKVVEQAKKQIELEKEKMLKEMKQEVGELVVQATEKVVKGKLSEEGDKKLVDDVVKSL